jgi:hypothetical protein
MDTCVSRGFSRGTLLVAKPPRRCLKHVYVTEEPTCVFVGEVPRNGLLKANVVQPPLIPCSWWVGFNGCTMVDGIQRMYDDGMVGGIQVEKATTASQSKSQTMYNV